MGFRVVALDFDLEAPGLHYKFSNDPHGAPLPVTVGVVDYLYGFIIEGETSRPAKDFKVDVGVPGAKKLPIQLIPAGKVLSSDYWTKLSRINWHDLFYSQNAVGVQVFLELKNRISDELEPDFLLVDSRTGITEMGGIATTLFADKVICLVLLTRENLEGARAVLRSLKRSRRESGEPSLEIMVALSRLPEVDGLENERERIEWVKSVMNEEAEDLRDTLACSGVFILHSEAALQLHETLRIGSGVSPDDSVLLRDYLRLFANLVPWESVEPMVHDLVEGAWKMIRYDPDAAVREVEELAESSSRPEVYRELLRFYQVRNIGPTPTLKRAQRLWELSDDPSDPLVWRAVATAFDPRAKWRRQDVWSPNLEFVRAVWSSAGNRNPDFAMKIAEAYAVEDRETVGADVLLEVIKSSEPSAQVVSRCIRLLDASERTHEADQLIQDFKAQLANEPTFVEAWVRSALRRKSKDALSELTQPPMIDRIKAAGPRLAALVFFRAGMREELAGLLDPLLIEVARGRLSQSALNEIGAVFQDTGRWDEFEQAIKQYPESVVSELADELGIRRRRAG